MPEIKAFRAWRFKPQKVKNLSLVVAPPYDVISKEEQAGLYEMSPYNVVRMELGKELSGDSQVQNRYTRAKSFLDGMKSEGVLVREDKPSIYVCVQDYEEEGRKKTRLGFFAAMKLDEKAVLKHENTLTGPKEDRLHLLKAVRTNLSPIFGLFQDKTGGVQALLKPSLKRPLVADVRVAGVRHRLYLEDREGVIRKIMAKMRTKPMFIADGHHRFEVACQFKRWMSAKGRGGFVHKSRPMDGFAAICGEESGLGEIKDAPWNYVLTYFSDCRHNPFKIFPTHRLIRLPKGLDLLRALSGLGEIRGAKDVDAVLEELADCRADVKDKSYQFGFYSLKTGFKILRLSKKTSGSLKDPVERLDVSVLHRRILDPRFGIKAVERSDAIDFTRDAQDACRKVQSGLFDAAVFLRPTSLDEMLVVSKKGLKMPQKSTYFYPKLLTGLVFYGFNAS